MLFEVDASRGKIGEAGRGGYGGRGGAGGRGATWDGPCPYTNPNPQTIGSSWQPPPKALPGQQGSPGVNGRDGAPGENATRKEGKDGTVSFCIIDANDNDVVIETAGYPYKLGFSQAAVRAVRPISTIYGERKDAEGERFFMGQELVFGPCAPVNTGGLSSPDSNLEGLVSLQHRTSPLMHAKTSLFPSVPAKKGNFIGMLPNGNEKELRIRIPKWHEISSLAPPPHLPSPHGWSNSLLQEPASFSAFWTVLGIPFWNDPVVHDWSKRDFQMSVVPPCQLDKSGLSMPASLSIGENANCFLQFGVQNNMSTATARPSSDRLKYVLRVAGTGFLPLLERKSAESTSDKDTTDWPAIKGFNGQSILHSSYENTVSAIPPAKVTTLAYSIKLGSGDNTPEAGSSFAARVELWSDTFLVQYCPSVSARIAPPLTLPTGQDVLFISSQDMKVSDYKVLKAMCKVMGKQAHFVDFSHYQDSAGKLPKKTWEVFEGKATVIYQAHSSQSSAGIQALAQDLVRCAGM